MPNHMSCLLYLFAVSRHAARVFVGCGVMSVSSTSASTSLLSPPRSGSGTVSTGLSTQSEFLPGAWFVLEPSNPQMGGRSPDGTIFVFDRSLAVGFVPSIQMYSAL